MEGPRPVTALIGLTSSARSSATTPKVSRRASAASCQLNNSCSPKTRVDLGQHSRELRRNRLLLVDNARKA